MDDEDCRNSGEVPSHGTVPKWLHDISQKIMRHHDSLEKSQSYNGPDMKQFFSSDKKTPEENAKFGRRSSLAAQLLAESPSSNLEVTRSDYLIPNFGGNFDFKALHPDRYQMDLEKSWKSLDNFQQSHKGRLDSAKTHYHFGDYDSVLSPIPSLYSPTLLDVEVPNRSRSEMSGYQPKKLQTFVKSAENVGKFTHDPIFERKLSDYQMRIDKENKMRDEIISELLSENEKITKKLEKDFFDADSLHRKVHNNSKYKIKKKTTKDVFIIPELPKGRTLMIDILSTWGDKYYVGLNGIEIFDSSGKIVRVKKISAIPPDVNVLPECTNDPRVVSNLLDGVNRTQDDMHIWLAPFEMGCSHIVTAEFHEISTISMIRIWNYNKSRIHSYRGVRDIVMFLDDQAIFKGEIAKACGGILGGVDAFGDTILFTTDNAILDNISKNDSSYSFLTSEPTTPDSVERPPTSTLISDVRPITGPARKTSPVNQILLGANKIELVLLSNWGHATMIGLTGLEVVEGADNEIDLNQCRLFCSKKGGIPQLARIANCDNITDNPANMWWVTYSFEEEITIAVSFSSFKYISGLRIWNYNASLEASYAGVRALKILLDGKPVQNPATRNEIFILRRAPGNCHYDFVQDIKLIEEAVEPESSLLDELYQPSTMPEGFVFQLIIFSSWGDQYYCGLNGIELYNQNGHKIALEEQNICAYPESVNSLPEVGGDVRTPDKLIDGVNADHSGSHSWLAPIIPKHLNRIYVVMDQPIVVSLVKLWNYSKTPNRGVKEFGILVDDLLVYNGTLDRYSDNDNYQTVLFTEDETVIGDEFETLIRNSACSQDVVLLDQDTRTTTGGSLPEADPALRPFTSVSPFSRGYTSHSH